MIGKLSLWNMFLCILDFATSGRGMLQVLLCFVIILYAILTYLYIFGRGIVEW